MSDEVKGDSLKSIAFLKAWPAAPTLTAIHIDPATGKKGRIETKAFPPGAEGIPDWKAVHSWVEARNGKANIYFLVNPTREPKDSKADRTDIGGLVALHVDVDVRVGEDQVEGIKRIVDTFNAYKIPPTVITSSGGGAQAFWLLKELFTLDGSIEAAEDAKLYNVQLERDLDGDHCHNIDRIMRLPGTVNVPDSVKIKKGRKAAVAYIVEGHADRKYDISEFAKAAPEKPKGEATKPKDVDEAIIYENVPTTSDDTPFFNLDDPRLTGVDLIVKAIIRDGKPPDDAPQAVKDMSRGTLDMKVVQELIRCGLTDHAIKQVYKLGRISADSSEWPRGFDGDMDRIIERARELARDPEIEALNRKFFVINIAGKPRIGTMTRSKMYPGQFEPVYSTVDDFRWLYRRKKKVVQVKVKDEDGNDTGEVKQKKISLVDYWLRHPQLRQYNDGMAFMPNTDKLSVGPDDDSLTMNLWMGFALHPVKGGSWELFKAHIHNNLCNGNAENSEYLVKWMAYIIQKRERTSVCVLLRGNEEGTGKGFFANHYGKLFGPHYMQVNNPEHVVGKFNPHIQSLLVLNADEAIFAGDPRHRNALWGLITEKWVTIEPKNFSAYKAPNYLNIIITTNADHAVPVGPTARRIFALDVAPNQAGHPEYFDAIEAQLEDGGYEAMLHDLMAIDLTDFDVRKCPKTEALAVQQAFSRHGVDALVEKVCSEARVPCPHYREPGLSITTSNDNYSGFDNYIDHSTDKELARIRALGAKRVLVREWGCMSGDLAQRRVTKDHITEYGTDRIAGIKWPLLTELRELFIKRHGPQTWLEPDVTEWLMPSGGDKKNDGIPF